MSFSENHTVILIPGLGDDKPLSIPILKHSTAHWKNVGLTVLIHKVYWRDGKPFEQKLSKLLSLIDSTAQKSTVSLVGTSAGASLAFNAFLERPNTVYKAVNVCGRLREGNHYIRSLERMAKTSQAFLKAVLNFENREHELILKQRVRLMTIRPFFGDELVPHDTAHLEGANNKWIYTPGHMLGIYLSLRWNSMIIKFLSS